MISRTCRRLSWEVQTIVIKKDKNNQRLFVILIMAIAAFFILMMGALGFFYYRSTPQYALGEIRSAVQMDNYKKFVRVMPKFSNGKEMTKTAFELFSNSIKENKSNIGKLVENKSYFKQVRPFFSPVKFLPKMRYIKVTTSDSATTLGFSSKKQFISIAGDGDEIGPFIPSTYHLSYSVNSKMYGELKSSEKFNLKAGNQQTAIHESKLFLASPKFQKSLLLDYVEAIKSEISCINDGLNFSDLKGVTDDVKASYIEYYKELKPKLKNYTESFSQVKMNTDSLKFLSSDEKSLEFDIYTDDAFSAISSKGEKAESSDSNASVTFSYDENKEEWLISNIKYDTFTGNASEWKHIQSYKLDNSIKGTWTSGELDKGNSV